MYSDILVWINDSVFVEIFRCKYLFIIFFVIDLFIYSSLFIYLWIYVFIYANTYLFIVHIFYDFFFTGGKCLPC